MTTRAPNSGSGSWPIKYRVAKVIGERLARRLGYNWGTSAVGDALRPFIADLPVWATDALSIGAAAIVQSPRKVAEWIGYVTGFDPDKVDKILNEAVDDGLQSFIAGIRARSSGVATAADYATAADEALKKLEKAGQFSALLSSDKRLDVFDCVDSLKSSTDEAEKRARESFYAMLAAATEAERARLRDLGNDKRWQPSEIRALLTQAAGRLDVFLNMLESKVARPGKPLSQKLAKAAATLRGPILHTDAKLHEHAGRRRRDLDRKSRQLQRSSDAIRAILRRK